MQKTLQRTVQFYWLKLRNRNSVNRIKPINSNLKYWNDFLEKLHNESIENRTISDTSYDGITDYKLPVLVVYEMMHSEFIQIVNKSNGNVIDYADNADSSELLAKSSAYAFFPKFDLVGRVSGNGNRSIQPLESLLNRRLHVDGYQWEAVPVVTVDSIERFRTELAGLKSTSLSFDTTPFLDPQANITGDAVDYYTRIANELGSDIHVDINLSLGKTYRKKDTPSKFKNLLFPTVIASAKQEKKAQVSGVDFAGKLLELNLVEHPVVEQSEIALNSDEPMKLSNLIMHLIDICNKRESDLYEITSSALS